MQCQLRTLDASEFAQTLAKPSVNYYLTIPAHSLHV